MSRLPALADLIETYLPLWVLCSVALGLALPRLAVVTRASTPILAAMIGSVSLTLSVERFRRIDARSLGAVCAGHATMPLLAYGVARGLGLPPAPTLGFVVLGAVTPELVTPVMTELAGGDTALSTAVLVVTGVASVAVVPAAVALLGGGVAVPVAPIVVQLAVAVVAPMLAAVALRARYPDRVGRYDRYYPAVAAVMVLVIVGGVAAANAALVRSNASLVVVVGAGALALNAAGYGIGALLGRSLTRPARIASILSVGMRDFAVAAALVVAAGLPAAASLPAVAFGVVEMLTSAGLARWFARER